MMDKSRAFLRTLGLPGGDLHSLPTSEATFPGGAQFGVEIPTVNTFAAAKALLRETQRLGVTVNRIDETLGAFRHTPFAAGRRHRLPAARRGTARPRA